LTTSVKLEVESSVEAADPDLDSDNPFIHHDAAASGSVNNSRRSASDQVNHLQNKIQQQTRYFTAKIRHLESQLPQVLEGEMTFSSDGSIMLH